jgi:serine protease Do
VYVAELQAKIAERHPGDAVKLTVYRDKRPTEVTIQLDEAPISEQPVTTAAREVMAEERLGIQVEPLTAELAQELGYDQAGGVVISEVQRTSPAARRGVQPGGKLVQVNDTRISSANDVRRALDAVRSGEIVSLHIAGPDGTSRVVNVRMP